MRSELLSLNKPVQETVSRHLVMTGRLIDDAPEEALAHALAARRLASRIGVVREAVGLAAYHAGEWQTAIAELRTYHRMSGKQSHVAVLADCERALGRPERAIDLFRNTDSAALPKDTAVELLIVAAGARGDLGQGEAAVSMMQIRELTAETTTEPWAARLRYAFADALLAVDRRDEAREWFARAAAADEDAVTDAAERLLELDGVQIEGEEDESDDESTAAATSHADSDADSNSDGDDADDDEDDDRDNDEDRDDDDADDDDDDDDRDDDDDADDDDEDDDRDDDDDDADEDDRDDDEDDDEDEDEDDDRTEDDEEDDEEDLDASDASAELTVAGDGTSEKSETAPAAKADTVDDDEDDEDDDEAAKLKAKETAESTGPRDLGPRFDDGSAR
ncbi:hypothetical protein ACIA8K_38870 [Catenuloplanes sp. NPDC051500]|uniref:hypothetical protein n=1 Tax=Catenuloplanes sp. NPDC051500 TaxID=3363959 RepID=UPI0037BDC1BA